MKNDFDKQHDTWAETPISNISLASQMLQDPNGQNTSNAATHFRMYYAMRQKGLAFMVEKYLQISIFEKDKSGYSNETEHKFLW